MLSRGISASGCGGGGRGAGGAGSGLDRGRVGERLQAALAGLQELHLLREKQGDMVTRALQPEDRRGATSGTPAAVQSSRTPAAVQRGSLLANEEQRLEATLTALKQQLVGGRRAVLELLLLTLLLLLL